MTAPIRRFDSAENGIRVLSKLLRTYQVKYGLKTVAAIISLWTPSSENDTGAYVTSVQQSIKACTGKEATRDLVLTDPAIMTGLVKAIIKHEIAGFEYPGTILAEGVRRALSAILLKALP
ncbi:structural protein [Pseudomonas sp. Pseusp122]|uniref:structural protein n=1 Tax=unclassified Pseudomonas TaxID=196821 RepID=UPI0039A57DBD